MTTSPATHPLSPEDRALLHALTTRIPGALSPRGYQIEGIRFARGHDYRVLVADQMGLGKTLTALGCLLVDPARLLPAVVVAPKSVSWRPELTKWAPGIPVHELKRGDALVPPGFRGIVLTRCGLLRDQVGSLVGAGIRTVILDEAHAYKDPTAQRSQAAADLCSQIPHVLALTGSPMPNGPHELAALLSLVAPIGEVRELSERRMIRRTSEDVGDVLPPLIGLDIPIEPEPDALAHYRRVEAQTRRELEVEGIDGNVVRSKLTALSHLTAAMKIPAMAERHANAVDEDLPSIIFCEYRPVAAAMLQALQGLKVRCALVTGESSPKQRLDAFQAFIGAKIDVLVATKVAREGLNLPRARIVDLLERDWVPDYERQKVGRARRLNSVGPVQAWFPRIPGTIDDHRAEVCADKDATADQVLGRLRTAFLSHTAAQPRIPEWAGGGNAKHEREHPVAVLLFDLNRWSQADITLWCRVSQYTALDVQHEDNGKRLVVRVRRKRAGMVYEQRQLRPGVVALVEKPRYSGRP